MKKVLTFLILTLVGLSLAMAQPQKMTYQMVVRDANNELLTNRTIGVKISILQDSINGLVAFAESHIATTNANALVTLQIGNGTQITLASFSSVDWANHDFFIKADIDPNGGNLYTISGIQNIMTVPYAFYATHAKSADSANSSNFALYANISYTANYADSTRIANSAISASNANIALSANYSDSSRIANYSIAANTANHAATASAATTAINATYSDTALYSTNSNHSVYADTALYANNSGNAINAVNAVYADTALFLMNAQNSDTAKFAYHSDTALYSTNSNHSVYADTALYANNSGNAINAVNAVYADTALFLMNAQNSDTAKFAYHSDTANYATNTNYANTAATASAATTAVNATYSDTALYSTNSNHSVYADTALYANNSGNAINAVNATYSDTTLYSINSNHSVYADTADYNKLVNKPIGANHGDILYWESSDSSWHIVPVGNIGETLTLDSNKTPHWSSNAAPTIVLPTIITDTILNITTNSARATGTVSADGGSPFVFSGLCWGTTQNPTTADFHTLNGIGLGSVSSDLLSLTMGTVYYVRAFATNSAGTAYGNELSFRTQTYPVVTTNAVSNISTYAAISGGNVTDDGGATVTARGVCWSSTSTAPTTADSHTTDGTGTGSFLSSMTPLSRNTKYYVRAYATNYIGTTYGDTMSFTTLADFPTVTTSAVGSITSVTAVVGGNVTDDGDATVTARGICWNSTGNPTLADNVLPIGSGYGSFSSTLTGLTASTVYYVCAYATNTIGTSYGSTISFTTAAPWTCGISTITDYDNNAYNTVQLGSQCWMAENLRTTHYANGSTITLMTSTTTSSTTGYRYYPGANSSNVQTYGYLYNWPAVMNGAASSTANPSGVQGPCPNGWHVPSLAEWTQLIDYVSSQSIYVCSSTSTYIAKSLASKNGWTSSSATSCSATYDTSTNNATGFNATPSGYYQSSGASTFGTRAVWWTATGYDSSGAYSKYFDYSMPNVGEFSSNKPYGRSVRCVKN